MKLNEVMKKEKESDKGTYAGVRFDEDTVNRVKAFAVENEIPNTVPKNKIHTTVLYSRKYLPDYSPQGVFTKPLVGKPSQFDVWESQPDEEGDKSNCLILQYDCSDLVDRHKTLMDEHDAEFDYDEFKPHITLSYDIGDFDVKPLDPKKIGDLNIVKEYGEDLDFNWAKKNT